MAASLRRDVKLFIIRALAAFDPPSEVVRAVKAEFDVDVSRQQVETYDPNKRAGRDLSDEMRGLFTEAREAFLKDTAEIAVSHRSVRLRTIQRLATKAEAMGNLPLVADLLERAAKEVGNVYTSRRDVTLSGPNGGPVETITRNMSAKEAAELYSASLNGDAAD